MIEKNDKKKAPIAKSDKYKISYVGLHPGTLVLLSEEKDFNVVSASFIEEFLLNRTINPVNQFFKLIYRLRYKNKFRNIESILLGIWTIFLKKLSSGIYRRYREYLEEISKNKMDLWDFEDKEEVLNKIISTGLDLIVINSWNILSDKIIFSPEHGTINIHPSKLPQYKGALPTLWSLKNRDNESAVTYMILDESMDGGGILAQHEFEIMREDDAISLEYKIEKIIKKTLVDNIKDYIKGVAVPKEQNKGKESKTARYEEYRLIIWEQEKVEDIYNKIILYPFIEPGVYCYTYVENDKIEIKNAKLYKNKEFFLEPGKTKVNFPYFLIGAKGGIIKCRLFLDIGFFDSLFFIIKSNKIIFKIHTT